MEFISPLYLLTKGILERERLIKGNCKDLINIELLVRSGGKAIHFKYEGIMLERMIRVSHLRFFSIRMTKNLRLVHARNTRK